MKKGITKSEHKKFMKLFNDLNFRPFYPVEIKNGRKVPAYSCEDFALATKSCLVYYNIKSGKWSRIYDERINNYRDQCSDKPEYNSKKRGLRNFLKEIERIEAENLPPFTYNI